VLLVCFGMPLQEDWLRHNWDCIHAHVALTGGAALDYTAGILRRSPRWLASAGLEWFWRLLMEPGRLWERYIIGNPKFLLRVLRARLTKSSLVPERSPNKS
jgi:N-acetylglucosaminyldiphosphoundecaprenol N-acetyl-beta-D-mannosaminyltransferase